MSLVIRETRQGWAEESVLKSLCQGEVNPDAQTVGQEKPVTEQ